MSREINVKDPKKLSESDRQYLWERGRLPEGAEPPRAATGRGPLADYPNTGDANTFGLTNEEIRARLERLAELEAAEAERNLAADRGELAKEGSPQAEGEKEYSYGDKSDDELRAELESRGLKSEGERKALRTRLVKDDRARAGS